MRTLLTFLLFAMIPGCGHEVVAPIRFTATTDTLYFEQSFPGLFQYKHTASGDYLYGWNEPGHELLIYDLNQKKVTGRIPVSDSTFEGIKLGDVNSFFVHNHDSVFIQRIHCISMLDSSGTVRFRKIINAPGQDEWPPVMYNNWGKVFPIYFDAAHKKLYMRQYSGEHEFWKTEFYTVNVEGVLSMSDTAFGETPVGYPDIYRKYFYGELMDVFREVNDSCNIYSFEATPDIITYNRYTGNVNRYEAKTTMVTEKVQPLDTIFKEDMNRRMDHMVQSPLRLKMLFDPYKGLYYGFILNAINLKNDDGTYNEFGDKELIIAVFDRQFRLLGEANVGKGHLWFYSFVTPRGLYLRRQASTNTNQQETVNENKFVFDIYDFGNP